MGERRASMPLAVGGRQLPCLYLAIAVSFSLACVALSTRLAHGHMPSSLAIWASSTLHKSPLAGYIWRGQRALQTRVGPRSFAPLYPHTACSAHQLIDAVGLAHPRDDGPSRLPFVPANESDLAQVDLSALTFSFDPVGCPPLHVYSSEEALDLLSAFGGVLIRGDSIMRQLFQGLEISISETLDLSNDPEQCNSERLFTSSKYCKSVSFNDTSEITLDRDPRIHYETIWGIDGDLEWKLHGGLAPEKVDKAKVNLIEEYDSFLSSVSEQQRRLSPVFIHSTGVHYDWRTEVLRDVHIVPFLNHTSTASPRPVSFFAGYTWPPHKVPGDPQGGPPTARYNIAVRDVLQEINEGESVSEGRMTEIDFLNMTHGAIGYDDMHYSYQVAMERAHVVLNVLDV